MGAKELQGQGCMLSLMVEETPDIMYWSRSGPADQKGTKSLANVCQHVAPPDFGLESYSERTVPRVLIGSGLQASRLTLHESFPAWANSSPLWTH